MAKKTNYWQNQAKEEIIERITDIIDSFRNNLLMEEFDISDSRDLTSLSITKLLKIADYLDKIFF